ncbi:glycoside hydrolase family 28 protein [Massilia sp. S19_KUP03_FR1]|uniref:glycoside hydrolase family 28 protein n=1 Tax=Massilia sp. S19_KUP03_FR1 TaxID=3025503 RepID=UPI002FCD9F2C
MKLPIFTLCALALSLCTAAAAQDSRTVTEPRMPSSCAQLLPATGANDAPRIQAALDACAPGHALHLAPAGGQHGFTSGPLRLPSGVTLVIDGGAILYASSDPMAYDRGAGTCGSIDAVGRGCRPFISADNTSGAGIMGDGEIDGRGGQLVDGKAESWWQLARRAQQEKGRQNVPRLIEVSASRAFTMHAITLRNSPNFHVTLNRVDGFTAWRVRIDTPPDARNTDGIDPISSRNVTIAHSFIRTGDDNLAIKAGNNGPSEHISILHNHFYSGHGMSIGSETNGGVRAVLVDDLTMDGTTAGLRIKSNDTRGGDVHGIVYRDVCLRNVKTPISIGTRYEAQPPGALIPSYSAISMERVHSVTPGRVLLQGYDAQHPLLLAMGDVVVAGTPQVQIEFARLSAIGSGWPGQSGQLNAPGVEGIDCSARFIPFPPARQASQQQTSTTKLK